MIAPGMTAACDPVVATTLVPRPIGCRAIAAIPREARTIVVAWPLAVGAITTRSIGLGTVAAWTVIARTIGARPVPKWSLTTRTVAARMLAARAIELRSVEFVRPAITFG